MEQGAEQMRARGEKLRFEHSKCRRHILLFSATVPLFAKFAQLNYVENTQYFKEPTILYECGNATYLCRIKLMK